MSQLKKSINIPMEIMFAKVPIFGNSRKPMEEIVIMMIPIIIDQSPIVKPSCLNKPICSTYQDQTTNRYHIIVKATPRPMIAKPKKKKNQLIPNSLFIDILFLINIFSVNLLIIANVFIYVIYYI